MQPTTLNKIVSLFLVGGLVILGIGAILLHHFGVARLADAIKPLTGEGGKAFLAVASGILLLPIAAVAGAVSEGLTAITIKELIRWLIRQNWALVFLRQEHTAKSYFFWRERFAETAAASGALPGFPLGVSDRGVAVGLLYEKKSDPAIQWAESHYSMYVLASNFTCLTVIATVYLLLTVTWPGAAWAGLGAACIFYLLLAVSMDRYLYSYEVAFRQSTLSLRAEVPLPALPRLAAAIETKDLLLRTFIEDDLAKLIALLGDEEVMKHGFYGKPMNVVEANYFIGQNFATGEESLFPRLGTLCLRSSGEVIGLAGYMPCWYLGNTRDFELAFVLSPAIQREEYATQIGGELLDFGLNVLCLSRLLASCHPDDQGSRIFFKKNLKMSGGRSKRIPGRGQRCIFRKTFTPRTPDLDC